ncbi:NADH dehydrogenase [ubiquinone] 1 beta subcomplex subunit 8, mitochondrial [Bacillus rossius redtenbacheri]|uniref:NADH dehydrogenase [ubiquinone] 1 beta subcomplex subunit 8, mitochondrial n=1 Tax=Bacillus rossius redtenbacheri TaxID=93214 RepID=UPI002FDDA429
MKMAALTRALQGSRIFKLNASPVYQVFRNHWNKDWKPGPYPVTKEEREAAAKKYGLLPEEYEPYPDDGLGHGDYPKLPDIAAESKDPYYPWDFPEHKRNFNEPLHVEADMYGEDRFYINERPRYSVWTHLGVFLAVMGGLMGTYYFFEDRKSFRPVLPRQYPTPGVVHYTFEPAE